MKLRYSLTSPFVRKVLAAARELGIADRIEKVDTDAWSPETDLGRDNPLGKVPALLTDEGLTIVDSKLIVDYLDALAGGGKIIPGGAARWSVLNRAMIADGVMEAALMRMIEKGRRPADKQWDAWHLRQQGKIEAALTHLEKEVAGGVFDGAVDIAQITLGCALGYLDFRFGEFDWRSRYPALAAWYAEFSKRPSMSETAPA